LPEEVNVGGAYIPFPAYSKIISTQYCFVSWKSTDGNKGYVEQSKPLIAYSGMLDRFGLA